MRLERVRFYRNRRRGGGTPLDKLRAGPSIGAYKEELTGRPARFSAMIFSILVRNFSR